MLIDDLRGVFLFDGLSDEQLHELIAAGDEVHFERGDVLFQEGEAADFWWVLVKGRVELLRRTRWEESVAGVMDRPGVWAGGFRAWSDQAGYLATGRGAGPGVMLRVPAAALGARARAWFPFGVHLIEGFFQTVRNMEALSRQREALAALGTLAAGLAHEINNPASAAVRAAGALQDTSDVMLSSLVRLAERSLSSGQFIAIDALRRELRAGRPTRVRWRSPIARKRSPTGSRRTGSPPRGISPPPWRQRGPTLPGASAPARYSTAARSNPAWNGWQARCRQRCC
jgi:CRP-like cAMP-binding protein